MYKNSGSLFITTNGIKSGPGALDESRLVINLLNKFRVREILFSFRLVLTWKACKEIPESSRLGFFKKYLANNFALSDAEGN